ncbi:hypothetical protein J5491_01030 [Candidatus Saccharibacteria bacterium]|nr:hypothetical protein [Candidatus Saccharibacteria bacterium]
MGIMTEVTVRNKYAAGKEIEEFFSELMECRKKIAAGKEKLDDDSYFLLRISCEDFNEDEVTIYLADYAETVSCNLDYKNKESLVAESYEGWAQCDDDGWIKCFLEKRVEIEGPVENSCWYEYIDHSFVLEVRLVYRYYLSYGDEFRPISEEECLSICKSLVSDEAFCSLIMEKSKEGVR